MWESIQSMCLHVVFILFTILIYQVFFIEREEKRKKIHSKFFLFMMIILVFTMSQPVVYDIYKHDFKAVVIILSFLYGGKRAGFMAFLALLVTGYFTDQNMLVLAGNYSVYCLLLLPVTRLFHRYRIKGKVIVISLFYMMIPITRGIFLQIKGDHRQTIFELSSSLIIVATLIAIVYLIENMNEQMEMKQELIRTEKMNVVSQLAASVAHEIRNPMTSVRGFMQLMQKEENLTKEQHLYISISIEELDRAQGIINQYLALAKPQTDQYETIDLSSVIHQSIDVMYSYAILNSIHITQQVESGLEIEGLKLEIQQVLINIIKNAIEAIKSEGEIWISAAKQSDGYVSIQIKDNGVGMTETQLKKIGSPYYSTKEKGTGLGLTVCHQIVKQMGGNIMIKSELQKGTCFTIHLPLKKQG
ncbi:hypothetical protein CGZ90_18660 [Fictibacillus aquaticus]|uniref:histidine kinase n=2 Tax=Fictibacillus aquaticus TaxID=2021314 RepID=A0A235F4P0_9BACL|nr:hypothetical protein CGZ90_18660 [Fictibacillus aquaticus]